MEETVKLRCVTHGHLILPRGKFNAESDQIEFSLQLDDLAWQPRMRAEEWDPNTNTFTMVSGWLYIVAKFP